jgi:predicted amidohydrolase
MARAIENGLSHAYVNLVGRGEEFTFVGGTMAVSSDGETLAETSAMEEVLDLNLEPFAKSGMRPDYLNQLRSPFPTVQDTPTVRHD